MNIVQGVEQSTSFFHVNALLDALFSIIRWVALKTFVCVELILAHYKFCWQNFYGWKITTRAPLYIPNEHGFGSTKDYL